jgi:hypothetical protein
MVHGTATIGLDTFLAKDKGRGKADALSAIEIDPSAAKRIRDELELLGIHSLALFPDLSELAEHIKRQKTSLERSESLCEANR